MKIRIVVDIDYSTRKAAKLVDDPLDVLTPAAMIDTIGGWLASEEGLDDEYWFPGVKVRKVTGEVIEEKK